MKKYIKKVIIFLLPIAFLILIPSLILIKSGEAFYNVDNVISLNPNKPYILGYAYNGKGANYEYFKFHKTVDLKPKVLALGSSRVLQFRDYMFNESFYNAGFTVGTIDDYLTFLKLLPNDYQPELLLLGFDQWMFNERYYNSKEAYPSSMYTLNRSLEADNGFMNILNVYKEVINGKINYKNINQKSDTMYLGLNAVINKKGFRNDGSFNYGANHKYYKDFDSVNDFFKREIQWIKSSGKYFIYGDKVNMTALEKYEELLAYCKDKNIKLISILPPLPSTVNKMIHESGKYDYINKISEHLVPLSQKYDKEFYDLTNIKELSLDEQYIDGHHGNEEVYGQALKVISKLNPDSQISNYLNPNN